MGSVNHQIQLVKRPVGVPDADCFHYAAVDKPALTAGSILVRTIWISVDPYMRGRMRNGPSYIPAFELGEVISGAAVGQVLESRCQEIASGDWVVGSWGWQEYAAVEGAAVRRLDPTEAPPSTALGVLGMPGLTAYFGILEVGRPGPGETVVISGAAGAVGMTAGQIAKILGCRVVGIAGGNKTRELTDALGFDAAIDYKAGSDLGAALAHACPKGIDLYFDNVGGVISRTVFSQLNVHGKVAVCGQIATYNQEASESIGDDLFWQMIARRLRLEGFLVGDFRPRFGEGLSQLTEWWQQKKLRHRETFVEGLENAPQAFLGLFRGNNLGKMLVHIPQDNLKS